MWVTSFKILPKELAKIKEVCQDIKAKDDTFGYNIAGSMLFIRSDTEKTASRRGYWFKTVIFKKELDRDVHYDVTKRKDRGRVL